MRVCLIGMMRNSLHCLMLKADGILKVKTFHKNGPDAAVSGFDRLAFCVTTEPIYRVDGREFAVNIHIIRCITPREQVAT